VTSLGSFNSIHFGPIPINSNLVFPQVQDRAQQRTRLPAARGMRAAGFFQASFPAPLSAATELRVMKPHQNQSYKRQRVAMLSISRSRPRSISKRERESIGAKSLRRLTVDATMQIDAQGPWWFGPMHRMCRHRCSHDVREVCAPDVCQHPSWLMALEMPAQSHAVMQEPLKLNRRFDKMHKRFFDNTYIDYAGCWWKDAFSVQKEVDASRLSMRVFKLSCLSSKQDAFFPFDSDPRRLKVALRWCCPRRLPSRDLDHEWMARRACHPIWANYFEARRPDSHWWTRVVVVTVTTIPHPSRLGGHCSVTV
jgi:hypothetical protein